MSAYGGDPSRNGGNSFTPRGLLTRGRAAISVGRYYTARAIRFPYQSIVQVATKSDLIQPAGQIVAMIPIVWESHLERIQGAVNCDAKTVILEHLNRKVVEFRPVVAHHVRNAVIADGSLFAGRFRQELRSIYGNHLPSWRVGSTVWECEIASLISTCCGSSWYGHWLEDELPLQLLAENFAGPIAHMRTEYAHEPTFRFRCGLCPPVRVATAIIKNLIVIDEFAQNPNKTIRYKEIRRRLGVIPRGKDLIYLARGSTGSRRILSNDEEIGLRLEKEGFHRVDVATSSAEQIIAACRGAKIVVSVEGSHLAPLLFLAETGATLIILTPPYQVHTTVADIGFFCSLDSAMFICEPEGVSRDQFRADPEELMQFLEYVAMRSKERRGDLERFVEKVCDMADATNF